MDLGMQVSFSESFNIVTADFVAAGTPIVASDDIEWMPYFLKAKPNSYTDIVQKLHRAWQNRGLSKFLQSIALRWYNFKAKRAWLVKL
jgi:hypothetical protein